MECLGRGSQQNKTQFLLMFTLWETYIASRDYYTKVDATLIEAITHSTVPAAD